MNNEQLGGLWKEIVKNTTVTVLEAELEAMIKLHGGENISEATGTGIIEVSTINNCKRRVG